MAFKRALVVGPGGLYGAYDAGVLATLCRQLGSNYFDRIYACSVGVFAGAFFMANQPGVIENTWRNLVDGKKLVNFTNPLFGKEIVNRDYLIEIFSDQRSMLDLKVAFGNNCKLTCVLTRLLDGESAYKVMNEKNWKILMKASTALPLFTRPVLVEEDFFIDGGLSDPLPVLKALEDGFDEVIVVLSREKGAFRRKFHWVFNLIAWILPGSIRSIIHTLPKRSLDIEIKMHNNSRVKIIRPEKKLPLRTLLDVNKKRINESFNLGVLDAMKFLSFFKNLN